jgi:hypothetical protein
MATLATETFPRKLCWKLLGFWVAFIGGSIFNVLFRAITGDTTSQFFVGLLIFIALLAQVWGGVVAIRLLVREPRYQSRKNIAMTVAGLIPITYLLLQGLGGGLHLHM